MKIGIIAPRPVPYTPGGAEAVWAGLLAELNRRPAHQAELVTIDVPERTLPEVMAGYQAFAELDVSRFDLVIVGKYPAWMVEHPNKVVYLLHPLRGLYDSYHYFGRPVAVTSTEPRTALLQAAVDEVRAGAAPALLFDHWRSTLADLGPDHPDLIFPGAVARLLVHTLDGWGLRPAAVRRYFAISHTVARRADYFPPGVRAGVVYPPSDLTGLHSGPGEFFFTASRHDGPKRLDLLISAMAHYPGRTSLVIGGTGPLTPALVAQAAGDRRIRFTGRLPADQLVDHYSRAIGVPFLPLDEDLGLITLEAMASGKPVLTVSDAGGPTEFVTPGRTGVVTAPTAAAIGRGLAELERLAADPGTGVAARQRVRGITWQQVGDRLLAPLARDNYRADRGRPRLVITSTFPVWPRRHGGQLRAFHLYRALTTHFDVQIVSLAHNGAESGERVLADGMVERCVPLTPEHLAAEAPINRAVGVPVTDIVASRLISHTPRYCAILAAALAGADVVLLAQPYLHPVVRALAPGLPVVYDAYNCEYDLKLQMLPSGPESASLLAEVAEIEGAASRDSALVLAVSDEDAAMLGRHYGVPAERIALARNGVDLLASPYVAPADRAARRSHWLDGLHQRGAAGGITALATFIGSWHGPNIEAARSLISLSPGLPEVGFLLMGNVCAALDDVPAVPGVFLLGMVSDEVKASVLSAADVALAPLTTGSGTNLKVVEYLAFGAPLVSTPVGLRGIGLRRSLARVADVADFGSAIRAELADTAGAPARTAAARAHVEDYFDWTSIGASALAAIRSALDRAATTL